MEPIAIGFPFARTIVAIRSRRTVKRTGKETLETRYYLSSQDAAERSHAGWIALIRDHWAGLENRNHWRRDAVWQEDDTRSSQPRLLANLALVRGILFRWLHDRYPDRSHPEIREHFAAHPSVTLFTS